MQPSSISPFAASQVLLRERLHFLVTALPEAVEADVRQALSARGKLLSHPASSSELPAGVWPLLTLGITQHLSPDVDLQLASSVALAVECFVCAIDLLDDVIDGDETPSIQILGTERALAVSTVLLSLAQQAILSLTGMPTVPKAAILPLLETFQASSFQVVIGQHQDLLAERQPFEAFTVQDCLALSKAKSGSLMSLACRLGAMAASASDMLCRQFAALGELVGMSHQLDNDCHDLYDELGITAGPLSPPVAPVTTGSVKTDLARGKKTLPVVLLAQQVGALQAGAVIADTERERWRVACEEAIATTRGLSLLYHERAHALLLEIEEATHPFAPALRQLLDPGMEDQAQQP